MKSIKSLLILLTTMFVCFANAQKSRTITGKVTDEKGQPLVGASIKIKNSKTGATSKFDGSYSIGLSNEKSILIFSYVDFEQKEIKAIDLKPTDVVTLKQTSQVLNEIVLFGLPRRHSRGCPRGCYYCLQKSIPVDSIKVVAKITSKILDRESIKLYPNPATKNSVIHITIKETGNYALHFFDAQSRLLVAKNIVTNSDSQTTELPLSASLSSGNYFISILNNKTQKQVTEKIIVQ